MVLVTNIVGFVSDEAFADTIHELGHAGRIEYLSIPPEEVSRRRFRLDTDKGTNCAIALSRDLQLADGAIVKLDHEGAIVVRLGERQWLALAPRDTPAALELGYFAGNLHWKVRFDGGLILIALEGPRQTYFDRLELLLADGKVRVAGEHD